MRRVANRSLREASVVICRETLWNEVKEFFPRAGAIEQAVPIGIVQAIVTLNGYYAEIGM